MNRKIQIAELASVQKPGAAWFQDFFMQLQIWKHGVWAPGLCFKCQLSERCHLSMINITSSKDLFFFLVWSIYM